MIIGFLAPPLLKLHVVFTVSKSTVPHEITGIPGINLACLTCS